MQGAAVKKSQEPDNLLVDEAQERHEIYESMRLLYKAYVHHLLLSAAGAAAISAMLISAHKLEPYLIWPFWNSFVSVGILLIPVLCISWAGGWVYLNLELWAHRHYLTYLECRAAQSRATDRLYLYPDVIEGVIYQARPAKRLFSRSKSGAMTYHSHLDSLVALFPIVAGLIAMGFGTSILWQGPTPVWRGLAVVYAVVMLSLYFRVFYIKIVVSQRLNERLGISPSR
jgi:hypothetical protein